MKKQTVKKQKKTSGRPTGSKRAKNWVLSAEEFNTKHYLVVYLLFIVLWIFIHQGKVTKVNMNKISRVISNKPYMYVDYLKINIFKLDLLIKHQIILNIFQYATKTN